jgi:hypothetical protein
MSEMLPLGFYILGCLLATSPPHRTKPVWKPRTQSTAAEAPARAILSSEQSRVLRGKPFSIEYQVSGGGLNDLYNPFLLPVDPPTAKLAVFNSRHKYVGDLMLSNSKVARAPQTDDWMNISWKRYAGRKIEFVAGRLQRSGDRPEEFDLRTGKYYLQLVFHSRFVSNCPIGTNVTGGGDTMSRLEDWQKNYHKDDVFRSNSLEVELVEE